MHEVARHISDQIRLAEEIRDRNSKDLEELETAYSSRINGNTIVSPWSEELSADSRAAHHMMMLGRTYGGGHPGSSSEVADLRYKQVTEEMLTWIVLREGTPVGMVNFEISGGGIAEAVRSVAVPPRGENHRSEDTSSIGISAAMYKRILDVFERDELLLSLGAIEGDVRLASEIQLPNNKVLPSGARTQHINKKSGLNPYLLCVPRYQVHPSGGVPHQEVFLQSRRYINPDLSQEMNVLHLPEVNTTDVGMTRIVNLTWESGLGVKPQINSEGKEDYGSGRILLEETAGIHFSRLLIDGSVGQSQIKPAIHKGLCSSRFLEIVVSNRPESVLSQHELLRLGAIPLGVFPAMEYLSDGEIVKVEPTIHYGVARPEIISQMVELELARDYHGTELGDLILQLREMWRYHA